MYNLFIHIQAHHKILAMDTLVEIGQNVTILFVITCDY
jgi:hypothetical protein